MQLNLDERHEAVLTSLAAEQELSKTALMRQALRLYQMVYERQKAGQSMAWRNADGSYVQQVVVGLPAFD